MKLILPVQRDRLLANYKFPGPDHAPVVKWFSPWGAATWLLTEMKAGDEDILFGLCDWGLGHPSVGYVSRREIEALEGSRGQKIERDDTFIPRATISVYLAAALRAQQIVFDARSLISGYQAVAEDARRAGVKLRASIFLGPVDTGEGLTDIPRLRSI